MKDKHIIEALGKTKIIIRDGNVEYVGKPLIKYCPIFYKYRGIKKITRKAIKENIEFRIRDFGMCTPKRKLYMEKYLSYGTSEIISSLLQDKILDCAVMVCDGAGTVIVNDPMLAQGIGGRISGIISTTPIETIIKTIGEDNVLNKKTAEIDQVKGVKKAIDKGYKSIAVTVTSVKEAIEIRKIAPRACIFAVHLTGISKNDAEKLFEVADIITSCASKYIRKIGDKKALLKVGRSIPVYAATKKGKKILLKFKTAKKGSSNSYGQPYPLI